jgi:prevent-host-death family protein
MRSIIWSNNMDHTMVQTRVPIMRIPVTEAKAQLTELVRRAEAGDEVILTRHGQAVVRLVPITAAPNRKSRHALLVAVRASAAAKIAAGPSAARSQDFLYGDDGMPQ